MTDLIKKNTYEHIQIEKKKKREKTINEDTPIFLYYNRFALYPDTTIQEIVDHSPGTTEFDINFSFEVQYG